MTGRDPMPFGKHKGTPLSDVDPSYLDWLVEQDWVEEKWPQLFKWLNEGDTATSTPKEREVIKTEEMILNSLSVPFRKWWFQAYGDRLRKDGEHLYIGYLRVAATAWEAASKQLVAEQLLPKPTAPKDVDVLAQPKPVVTHAPKPVTLPPDEEINF